MDNTFLNLLIEVKCSRKGRFAIKERDIKGLNQNQSSLGFLATLITSNVEKGPHWLFIPADKMTPRSYTAKTLKPLHTPQPLLCQLNYLWGDILLNSTLIDKLLNMKKIDFKSINWWQNLPYEPLDIPQSPIRNIKVAESLLSLRNRLDEKHGRYGSRREGFLHQCIIHFALVKLGLETISNTIGVPDLRASGPRLLTQAVSA